MKNINNKAIITALAITVGAAQAAPDNIFSVRDVTTPNQLIAHGGLSGNCAGHAEELAKMQTAADAKKKSKKKAKKSTVKARFADSSAVVDNEEAEEDSEDSEEE